MHRHRKQTYDYQRGKERGINQEMGINRYTLVYIKQINSKDLLYNIGNYIQYLDKKRTSVTLNHEDLGVICYCSITQPDRILKLLPPKSLRFYAKWNQVPASDHYKQAFHLHDCPATLESNEGCRQFFQTTQYPVYPIPVKTSSIPSNIVKIQTASPQIPQSLPTPLSPQKTTGLQGPDR